MKKRDTARIKHEKPRGILKAPAAGGKSGLTRYWPAPDLAPFVEHFWVVRWDVREPLAAETVPHPSVHLVLETSGRAEVVGVMNRKFTRLIEGRGRVVGTKFRPGAFRAFVSRPVSDFTNLRPSVTVVFGERARTLARRVLESDDDLKGIAVLEPFLRNLKPRMDESIDLAGRVAARIAEDRSVLRVEQIVSESGVPLRRLQRLFKEYVGVSPKWTIQRYRLLEAAERMAAGVELVGADLALELGYSDQAHFIRDFKRFVGKTPAVYVRERAARGPD